MAALARLLGEINGDNNDTQHLVSFPESSIRVYDLLRTRFQYRLEHSDRGPFTELLSGRGNRRFPQLELRTRNCCPNRVAFSII
jgi:hypothetical protein